MASINLSDGIIRSMTRGAPARTSPDPSESDRAMTLLDKMDLLRAVAENPPQDLQGLLQQFREGGDTASVFARLRTLFDDGGAK